MGVFRATLNYKFNAMTDKVIIEYTCIGRIHYTYRVIQMESILQSSNMHKWDLYNVRPKFVEALGIINYCNPTREIQGLWNHFK